MCCIFKSCECTHNFYTNFKISLHGFSFFQLYADNFDKFMKITRYKDSFQEGHEKINPRAFAIRKQFKTTIMHCFNTLMHYKLRFKAVIK